MSIDRTKISWNGWGWTAHKDEVAGNDAVWSWLASEVGMPSLLATPPRALEDVPIAPSRLPATERDHLARIVGADRVSESKFDRAFHARGRSYHDLLHLRAGSLSSAPDAVVYPRSTEDVLAILAVASERGIAVIPYGGGTSVVGGVTGTPGEFAAAISLDMSGMSKLIGIDALSRTATAEAGIYGPALDKALRENDVVLGHYPQSFEFSTLGGCIAHSGAGQQSSRYGRAEDWLMSVKVATPRGLLTTKDFPGSSAGPRLTDLILGSEGAFGVITEATFRVKPLPQTSTYTGFLFRDFASGATAIRRAVQEDLPIAMLRLSDAEETRFYRAYGIAGRKKRVAERIGDLYLRLRKFDGNAAAMIAGFEGQKFEVEHSRQRFGEIAKELGALVIGDGPGRRWLQGRFHGPYLREPLMDRGLGVDTLETATTWSNLDLLYGSVKKALEDAIRETAPRPGARGIVTCHISHSYLDGASLYFTYIFPRALDGDIAQWLAIKRAATDAIVARGGTISHHHGVGEDHLPWMVQEKGSLGVDILRAVKAALDPKGILNPGKLVSR
ncbi:MAG: FAD-binding oxidoreductase [Rhizomicrobium sp.]